MGAGRPSKFSEAIGKKIIDLYKEGKTDREVAKLTGISKPTLYSWRRKYPEFLDSIKDSKDVADDIVEACLYARATGYNYMTEKQFVNKFTSEIERVQVPVHCPPDVGAQIFWLKNRRPEVWRDVKIMQLPDISPTKQEKSFTDFCLTAGYPAPFPKQIEMTNFGMGNKEARLLLGSRGYGKTDYVVILGIAYDLYLNASSTNLIITKSKERNAAILREISNACKLNGLTFEMDNSGSLRLTGLQGKDHSVSAVTIKTVTLRGRHPKRVIMDDPVTEDDVSEATRLHVERVYNEVNKLAGNILIIGQPAHKYDLYAKIRGLVKTMEVPHGTIKELDHDLEAQRLAGVDEASISASYFLKVLTEGTSPFDKVRYMDEFPTGDSSVAFIDPSFEGGDYTALSIVKSHMQGIAVVGFVYKKAWNHCLSEMVPHLKKYNVKKLCFETNSLGDMPLKILRDEFGGALGIAGRKSNTNKHARIMAAGTYAHLIHLCKQSDKVYIDQVVKYEYKAKHDDAPDSLASCLEWIGLIRGKV